MNDICRNFEINEKSDGVLKLLKLNCDTCSFKDNCGIQISYNKLITEMALPSEVESIKKEGNKNE